MAEERRPEVNLEINSGFFRIPTREMIYNITVIAGHGGIPIVEKIVEVEKKVAATGNLDGRDPYFQQISVETLDRLAGLGRSFEELTGVMTGLKAAGADPEKIKEARTILAGLKDAAGASTPSPAAETDSAPPIGTDFAELVDKLQQVKAMFGGPDSSSQDSAPSAEGEPGPAAASTSKRYLFDLDVVFQTLYELCTNETVKSHIATARENRDTYFDKPLFLDRINEKVAELEADGDNFFNVPMSDVLSSLLTACSEKPIQNLLKKMDTSQGSIFLDSILPLEVPEAEEAEVAADSGTEIQDSGIVEETGSGSPEESVRFAQAGVLLDEVLQLVDGMAGKVSGKDVGDGAVSNSETSGADFVDRITQVDKMLVDALEDSDGKDNQAPGGEGSAAFRQRLLEAVLTLHEEIRLKEANEALTADEARQQAASSSARRVAGIKSRQDAETLLDELGL